MEEPMRHDRCPSCENDLTGEVSRAVIQAIQSDATRPAALHCPHCDAALCVAIDVRTVVSLENGAS